MRAEFEACIRVRDGKSENNNVHDADTIMKNIHFYLMTCVNSNPNKTYELEDLRKMVADMK